MNKEEEYELSRCRFYKTTINSCSCPGYQFRRNCRHVTFLQKRIESAGGFSGGVMYNAVLKEVVDGIDASELSSKYGESIVQKMLLIGDVFEKHGKLYVLK